MEAVIPRRSASPLAVLLIGLVVLASVGCGSDSKPADEPRLVDVPDVVGEEGTKAVNALEQRRLVASFEESDPAGCRVTKQDEVGRVEAGTKVVLTLHCRQRDGERAQGPTAVPRSDLCGTTANPNPRPECPGESGEGSTSYRVGGSTWATYSQQEKLQAARLFVENNPNDCRGVDPAPLPGHIDEKYDADTPQSTRVSEVMLEICRLSQAGE